MKSKALFSVIFMLVVVSMLAVACAPAATPTTAAPVDQPTAVMENPTEQPTAAMPDATATTDTSMEFTPMSQAAPDCNYGGLFKEIAALDTNTVQFTMCVPDPAFASKAAFSAFSIQPKEWIEQAMASGEILEKPVGTGPYVLDSWNRGDSIVYKKLRRLLGRTAKTDTLVFRWTRKARPPARAAIRHGRRY